MTIVNVVETVCINNLDKLVNDGLILGSNKTQLSSKGDESYLKKIPRFFESIVILELSLPFPHDIVAVHFLYWLEGSKA
jgi:hypothetical protein